MIKTSIVQGNSAIRAFNDRGIFYGGEAIPEITPYQVSQIEAGREYKWDFRVIGQTITPVTLFGYKSTGVSNSNSLIIRIQQNGTILWEIDLAGNSNTLGNSFFYNFPFFVIAENQIASVISSVDLDSVVVFAKNVHLNPPVPPQT
ncbi:hypothetical protein AA637_11875 [Cyanobacterium sp. HL-69]|uniref:hypothetical protein n=1 Tax=Cyanobacterium sp. HL-69 TaxID=2054282 RepID=UPI000CA1DADF|nr:hypothetical protein AA637_11875 [Cyanobacterium sp. HL-69]